MSKNTRTRILLTAVAALLLVTMAVGGTLAWLQATTKEVTNTFKPHEVSIKLEESELKEDGSLNVDKKVQANTYQMIPGYTYGKDPAVTVTYSVPVYVFVLYNNNDADGVVGVNFALDDENSGWTKLTQNDYPAGKVYYKLYENADLTKTTQEIPLLSPETITFNSTWNTTTTGSSDVIVSFQAWAVQAAKSNTENFTPEAAWENRAQTATQE